MTDTPDLDKLTRLEGEAPPARVRREPDALDLATGAWALVGPGPWWVRPPRAALTDKEQTP